MADAGWLYDEAIEIVYEDPQRAIDIARDAYETADRAHNQTNYHLIKFLVWYCLTLHADKAKLNNFLQHPFWQGEKRKPGINRLPMLATRYILGVTEVGTTRYKQVSEFAQAVRYFLYDFGDPDIVVERLTTGGGIDGFLRAMKADEKQASPQDEADADDEGKASNGGGADPADQRQRTGVADHAPTPNLDPARQLVLNMEPDQLLKILKPSNRPFKWVRIARKSSGPGEWVPFEVLDVKDEAPT